jgi:hypothetical protein
MTLNRTARMYLALRRTIPSYPPALAWSLACLYTQARKA